MKYWYAGELSSRKPWPKEVKKAWTSLRAQRERCSNKNCKNYPHYGAKGIRVKYEAREFIGWYLEQLKKKDWADPTVGRIDHDRDYTIDNIEMQERVDNSKERNVRKPPREPRRQHWRAVLASKNGVPFATFFSITMAADYFGVGVAAIANACAGRAKTTAGGYNLKMIGKFARL